MGSKRGFKQTYLQHNICNKIFYYGLEIRRRKVPFSRKESLLAQYNFQSAKSKKLIRQYTQQAVNYDPILRIRTHKPGTMAFLKYVIAF